MLIFELLTLPAALMPRGLTALKRCVVPEGQPLLASFLTPFWPSSFSGQCCPHIDRSLVATGTCCLESPEQGSTLVQTAYPTALFHQPQGLRKVFVQGFGLAYSSRTHEQPA